MCVPLATVFIRQGAKRLSQVCEGFHDSMLFCTDPFLTPNCAQLKGSGLMRRDAIARGRGGREEE
jgi:hypothetical protein